MQVSTVHLLCGFVSMMLLVCCAKGFCLCAVQLDKAAADAAEYKAGFDKFAADAAELKAGFDKAVADNWEQKAQVSSDCSWHM
jgi:hypothetical protein